MRPILENYDDAVYFTDSAGERFRIEDVAFRPPLAAPGTKRVMPLENPDANHRYFVSSDGLTRAYRFAKKEVRDLTVERLTQQLAGAGFVATTPANISALKRT